MARAGGLSKFSAIAPIPELYTGRIFYPQRGGASCIQFRAVDPLGTRVPDVKCIKQAGTDSAHVHRMTPKAERKVRIDGKCHPSIRLFTLQEGCNSLYRICSSP